MCNSRLNRIASLQYATPERSAVYALASSYRSDGQVLSAPRVQHRASLVRRLFHWRRPSAISRFVVTVVIGEAIQRRSRRPRAHIGDEIGKTVPALAHPYSTTAVVPVFVVFGIAAALPGGFPRHVFFGPAAVIRASRSAVASPILRPKMSLLTTATARVSTREIVGLEIAFFATRAATAPIVIVASLLGIGDNCQRAVEFAYLHGTIVQTSREQR